MARTAKRDESAENTEFGKRMIEGLTEALAWSRGEIALRVHAAKARAPERGKGIRKAVTKSRKEA